MKKKLIEMKHFCYLSMLIIMAAVSGCGGDDDDNVEGLSDGNPASLVGTWICTQIEDDEDGEIDIITPNNFNYYMLLNENGSARINPANLFEDEKRGNITWKVSGKKLLFSDNSEYTIKRLTPYDLVLEWIDEDEDGYLRQTHTFNKLFKEDANSGTIKE